MAKRLTTAEFIDRAVSVHGDRFDYSLVEYVGRDKPVLIVCRVHGVFKQAPSGHIAGKNGCKFCRDAERLSGLMDKTPEFVLKASAVHGGRYDYSVSVFCGIKRKVEIRCPQHGSFFQKAEHHLNGVGCPKCGDEAAAAKRTLGVDDFVLKARWIHGDKYDYGLVDYVRAVDKVTIVCSEHGQFLQTPNDHLSGYGCPECGGRLPVGNEKFIERAIKVHGDLYDYSLVEYVNQKTPVTIVCKKHGEFSRQPRYHVMGSGCPLCSISTGELAVRKALDELGCQYEVEYRAAGLVNPKTGKHLRIDFFIAELGAAIEFDGYHHFGGQPDTWEDVEQVKERDFIKDAWCASNDVELLRIPFWEKDNIPYIVSDFLKSLSLAARA